MTPTDQDAYVGMPTMLAKGYDEVHVSCTFTWDKEYAEYLAKAWAQYYTVKLGGPAYDDPGAEFVSGIYLRRGVTITSRGCPNHCSFCFAPKREGNIRELPIQAGNIVQDNNLLACSKQHRDKVFEMLRGQRNIEFTGGLYSALITDNIADQLRGLRVKALWLACDHPNAEKPLIKAVNILSKYFSQNYLRCYVLIGYGNDTLQDAECRLRRVYEIGCLPFAMLYQPKEYPIEWHRLQRTWCRPAAYKTLIGSIK